MRRVMERQVEDRQRRKGWIRFLKAIAAIVAVSFILARPQVMAQSTAQISGVVTDQSGAILPGVEVKAKLHHRSEEHTSEFQSRGHLVCRLLLEKKKDVSLDCISCGLYPSSLVH